MFFDGNGTYVSSDIQSDMYNICSDRLLTDEDIKHFTPKRTQDCQRIITKKNYICETKRELI